MNRAAIYARVSTGEQTTEQQVVALREAAARMGLDVVSVVEETGSGAKNDRPGLQGILDTARRGKLDAVLCWKLDRFGRSALDLLANIEQLQAAGVRFVATSQGIDVRAGGDAMSRLLLTMLAAIAEFERDLIRERTRLGMTKARAAGKHIGRPRASPIMLHAAADKVRAGTPLRKAARDAGVGVATLSRFLRSMAPA